VGELFVHQSFAVRFHGFADFRVDQAQQFAHIPLPAHVVAGLEIIPPAGLEGQSVTCRRQCCSACDYLEVCDSGIPD
jgi:hypothetical protein